MSGIGIAHSTLACVALALGAFVFLHRKGDRLHRTIGHLYFGAMLATNVTALTIYHLFGAFGPFHVAAVVSLATTTAGLVPVMIRRPRGSWYQYHARFMSWSYVGLLAAAASEAMVRLPAAPFAPAVFAATLGVTAVGAVMIHGRRAALLRRALRRAGLAAALALATSRSVVAQASAPASAATFASIDSAIAIAVANGDIGALRLIRANLGRLGTDTLSTGLALHYAGYAWYREATLAKPDKKRDVAVDSARALLEQSLKLLPIAESHALLASVRGLEISGSPWRAMLHGGNIGREEERARALDPNNPRVALLSGINAFHAPEAFGGGIKRAEEHLRSAIDLFARDHPALGRPAWGHAEAWAWLGRVRAKGGDSEGARAAYAKALEIEPGYEWVRRVLIPALDAARRPQY